MIEKIIFFIVGMIILLIGVLCYLLTRRKRKSYYNKVCDMEYYELHSHIIPAVDDGVPKMQMALKMLDEERRQGVRHVILTPHLRKDENDYRKIIKHYKALKSYVKQTERDVKLHLGCEIYYDSNTLQKLNEKKAFTMAGTRYVLIEFSPTVPFQYLTNAMDELIMRGYLPILAHAERYGCISEHLDRVEKLVSMGVYIQINASSFLKHPRKKELLGLIEDGLVHFIGTDCHRMDWRPVCMQETCRYLASHIEKRDYVRIFFENPKKLLKNEVI